MKKYVKPMMESEAFVSNEFVSACWTIECTNSDKSCGEFTGKNDYPAGLRVDSDGISGTYVGQIGQTPVGCRTEDTVSYKDYGFNGKWDGLSDIFRFLKWLRDFFNDDLTETNSEYFHPVKVSSGWDNHPNASI